MSPVSTVFHTVVTVNILPYICIVIVFIFTTQDKHGMRDNLPGLSAMCCKAN